MGSELHGVDISVHNGKVDFEKLSHAVDFVMVRGGYSTQTDINFLANAKGCEQYKIPYGVYWFSYAKNKEDAVEEAAKCLAVIGENKLSPIYPIAYDYEYDSLAFANKLGLKLSAREIESFAISFLEHIRLNGRTPMLYTNVDFYNRYYKGIANSYLLWLAQWEVFKPSIKCQMWQSTSTKKINGIKGSVDYNTWYKNEETTEEKNKKQGLIDKYWNKYYRVANEIIGGKYGVGAERKKLLKENGYDAEFAQAVVNYILYG